MKEISRRNKDELFPIGSIMHSYVDLKEHILYDHFEDESKGIYVEIWVPLIPIALDHKKRVNG